MINRSAVGARRTTGARRAAYVAVVALVALLLAGAGASAETFIGYQLPSFIEFPGGTAADSISSQIAYTACDQMYYVGASVIRQKQRTDSTILESTDGSALVGLGLGGCRDHPIELSLTVGDVSEFDDIFYNVKGLVTPETRGMPAIAIGAEDFTDTADSRQAERSVYVVATKSIWSRRRVEAGEPMFARSVISVGYGSGRFNHEPFVALSTSISARSKAIVEMVDSDFNAGFSVAPFREYPGVVAVVGGVRLNDSDLRTITAGVGITFWKEETEQ
jgi:hypothetical protein